MGANEHGLFVGLTNQRSAPQTERRSRGEIVMEALRQETPAKVESLLATIDPRAYNELNLVFGALDDVRVAYGRRDRPRFEVERPRAPIVVLANDRLNSPEFPKTERAELRARAAIQDGSDTALRELLADHERPPEARVMPAGAPFPAEILCALQQLCVHLPSYGTVSATILLYGSDGMLARYLYAPGPPCTTEFESIEIDTA